jgi:hypothetical protein
MTTAKPPQKKRATRRAPINALGINEFFAECLRAPVNNPRWSWGAYDPSTDTVFLRFWTDGEHDLNGARAWRVTDARSTPTRTRKSAENERREHIERIRQGAKGYAVLCVSKEPGAHTREIESYDENELLVVDHIVEQPDGAYAIVSGTLPVGSVRERAAAWSDEARDIEAIRRDPNLTRTERDALIAARMGQGGFRDAVLDRWGRSCALTGCAFEPMLRASHIKPWRLSENPERLDPHNGLPLAAHVDALFDRGFITFEDDGTLRAAPELPEQALSMLGRARELRRELTPKERAFLAFHRETLFGKMKPTTSRKRRRAPKAMANAASAQTAEK